jgi:hypothetical protein
LYRKITIIHEVVVAKKAEWCPFFYRGAFFLLPLELIFVLGSPKSAKNNNCNEVN